MDAKCVNVAVIVESDGDNHTIRVRRAAETSVANGMRLVTNLTRAQAAGIIADMDGVEILGVGRAEALHRVTGLLGLAAAY